MATITATGYERKNSMQGGQPGSSIPVRGLLWLIVCISLAAFGVSLYLAWTALSMGKVLGCGGAGVINCDHVLTSHWSKLGGIPVSVPAAGLYASVLVMLAFLLGSRNESMRSLAWNGISTAALIAGAAACWFAGLQVFALGHICPWCMSVHACGVILAGLSLHHSGWCSRRVLAQGTAALASVGVLVGAQALTPRADTFVVIENPIPSSDTNLTDSGIESAPGADGEYFAAPGEYFAAPVEADNEVFAAPTDAASPATAEVGAADVREDDSAAKADHNSDDSPRPSVAASLLLICPGNLHLLSFAVNEFTGETRTQSGDVTDDETTDESTAGKPDEKAGAGTSSAADAAAPAAPEPRIIAVGNVNGQPLRLDIRQWPMIGNPDAEYVLVEMFDYTCPHCRKTNKAMEGAFNELGDRLAVITLPVPLDRACNPHATGSNASTCEISRMAVAVWRIDAEKFREFHHWLMESERNSSSAREQAISLVGREALDKELARPTAREYIQRHTELYKKVGAGEVPKLLFRGKTVVGEVGSTNTLVTMIKESAGR